MSNPVSTSRPRSRATPTRAQDPEGTRQNIIEVAAQEFALNGLSGARIDEIAAKTRSSKRMIYYYFGSKEGLYVSALENAYRQVREGEAKLDIAGMSP
ncbi:MAG: TetR/AcrR family transcriptional regulator, partial [Devosia sp.]|nr:TetR/AcrR family transcriptional regulator [Devosia sp.]